LFAPITLNGSFFSSIQAAHNAAAPGDTAVLTSGTYTEAVTTTKNLTLQFSGDGVMANSAGTLTLGANLTITGTGSIAIAEDVSVGANAFVVDTQTAAGTTISITGPIHSTGGSVSILGQQTVTIGAAIDPPATLTLSSLDDVVVNAAAQALNLITVSAGEDGTGGLTIGAGGSLETTAAGGDITITTGTTSGNVALGGSVTSLDAVSITTAGTVNQTAGTITAASLGVSATGSVTANQANSVGTLGVDVSGLNNTVSFRNGGALVIGSASGVDGVSTNDGNVLIDSGQLTINQPILVGNATVRLVSSAGITQGASGTIGGNALGVNAAGNVVLSGNNAVGNFGASNSNAGSSVAYGTIANLTLATVGASGTFSAVSGVSTNAGDVLLRGGTSVDINQPIAAGGATVRIVAVNGTVNQAAAGTITATSLGVRATDDVTLTAAANNVGTLAVNTSGAGNVVSYTDTTGLTIGAVSADGGGIFTATSGITGAGPVTIVASGALAVDANVTGTAVSLSGGGVSQNGSSTVDGGSGLVIVDGNAGTIDMTGTLTTTNATASAVQILNGTTVKLGTISAAGGGLEVAGASSDVTQNVGETISAGSVSVSTGGLVNLGNNNSIGTVLGVSSNGGLTINDVAGGLIVSGPISNGAGDGISITTAGGALSIQTDLSGGAVVLAGAGITQTAGSDITATTLRLNSTAGATLNNAGNNAGTLAASVSGGALSYTDSDGLIIGAASGLNGINIGANALSLTANGSITQTQPVTAGAATFTSTLAAAAITLGDTTNAISGAITFAPSGVANVTLFNNAATNLAASTVGGNLSVTATGAITDSGTLNVVGSATLETRSNVVANITLDQALSTFGSVTARSRNAANSANGTGSISIVELGTMDVTAIASGTGAITLDATKINLGAADTVESSGAVTLQPSLASANINLGTNVPGVFSFNATDLLALKDGFSSISIGRSNGTGVVTVSSNVTFRDPVTITGGSFVGGATLATNGANDMTLHATTGTIGTLVTPLDVLVGGTLIVSTDGANANGDIFITSGGALALGGNITTDAGTAQAVNITANGITITASNGGSSNDNLTLVSTAAFTVNNVTLSGDTISITATNDITDTGTGVIATSGAGGLTLVSSAGGIGVDAGNALGVSVGGSGELTLGSGLTPVSGDVFVTSAGALTLGDVNTSGAVQTIDVRTSSGNLRLNSTVSGNDDWVLNSAGTLNNNGTTLTAASVNADGAGGIGTSGAFDVSTPIVSADSSGGLVNVVNSSAAAVAIGSLSAGGTGDVTYTQSGGSTASFGTVSSVNGNITLVNVGGSVALNGATSAGGGGDVQVTTAGAGDVTVNSPVSGVDVNINSAGNITTNAIITASAAAILDAVGAVLTNATVSGASVDISSGGNTTANANITASGTTSIDSGGNIAGTGTVGGSTVNLTAVTGIGAPTLDVAAGTLNASTSGLGAASINLTTSSSGVTTLNNVATVGAGADITVSQSGVGNNLRLVNVSAPAGNVTLSTGGTINEVANDDVGPHTAEITALAANLIANGGIGTTSDVDLTVSGPVTVNTVTGSVSISDSIGLTLGASSVGGDLSAVAETGDLTTTGAVDAGGNVTLVTLQGGRTLTIASTLSAGNNAVLTGDEIDLNGGAGSVSGVGTLVLQPTTTTQGINVGFGAGTGITDTDIAAIGGFANIIIGRANGQHDIVVDTASFPTNVNIRTPNGGFIRVDVLLDTLATVGAHSITLTGATQLVGEIRTAGGTVDVIGATTVQGGGTPVVDTTGGLVVPGGANITFSGPGTIDASGSTSLALQAGTGGTVSVAGNVGNAAALANFTVVSAADSTFGGTVRVSGDINLNTNGLAFNGGSNSVSSSGGGSLLITPLTDGASIDVGSPAGGSGTLDISDTDLAALADGFNLITIGRATGSGTTTIASSVFKDSVQFNQPAGTIILVGDVSTTAGATTGSVIFNGPVTVGAASVVDTNGAGAGDGDITFNFAVDGANALTATAGSANVKALGDIGGSIPVGSVTFSGNNIDLLNVDTVGNQAYTASGLVTLGGTTYRSAGGSMSFNGNAVLAAGATTVTSGGAVGDNITFTGTINGAGPLTLAATGGNISIAGAVGGSTPLSSITADGTNITLHNVTTTGAQAFNGTGLISLDGNYTNTTGAIDFNGSVTLAGPVTVNATGVTDADDVLFGGTIDGGQTLVITTATDGDVIIGGAVGLGTAVTSVDITSQDITLNGVKTTGLQQYVGSGILTLNSNYSNTSGKLDFRGTGGVVLGSNVSVTAGGSGDADDILFTGDISGANTLTLGTGTLGDVVINGIINNITSVSANANDITLHNVTTTGAQSFTGDGIISLNGNHTSTGGNISFNGNVRMDTSVTVDTTAANNDVLFGGTINVSAPAMALVVDAGTGKVTIVGIVGASGRPDSVTLSGRDMVLHSISTVNSQTYTDSGETSIQGTYAATSATGAISFNGNVSLAGLTTVSVTGNTDVNDITFTGTINGNQGLTLTASSLGDISVAGNIGGTTPLASLTATGQDVTLQSVSTVNNQNVTGSGTGAGGIMIGGNYISSAGSLTFTGVTNLTADTAVSAEGTADANDITFTGTINGNQSLALTTGTAGSGSGDIILSGAVGGTAAITTFDAKANDVRAVGVISSGPQNFEGSGLITLSQATAATYRSTGAAGAITLDGSVQVGSGAVTLNTTGALDANDINVNGTVNGASNVTMTAAGLGDVTLAQNVGGTTPLASLTVTGDSVSLQNAVTTGGQNYTGTAISTNATYTNNSAGAIRFSGPVTINSGGAVGLTVTNRGLANTADIVFTSTIAGGGTRPLILDAQGAGDVSVSGNATGLTTINAKSLSGGVTVAGVATTLGQTYSGGTFTANGTLTGTIVTATAKTAMSLHDVTTQGTATSTVDQNYTAPTITLNSNYLTNGPGAIKFKGNVALNNAVSVQTQGEATSDIVVVGRITGAGKTLRLSTLDGDTTLATIELGDTHTTLSGNNIDIGDLIINEGGRAVTDIPLNGTLVIAARDKNGNAIKNDDFTFKIRTSGDFTMTPNEKLVVLGSVSIDADTATIGDITAIGDINVKANHVTILNRGPGDTASFDQNSDPSGQVQADQGVDFVSGSAINFDSPDISLADAAGPKPRFATSDGANISGLNSEGFLNQFFDAAVTFDLLSNIASTDIGGITVPPGAFFDLRASGTTTTNPAATLAGAAPQESRQPEIENSVASSQAQELRNLGIFARDLDRASLIAFLEGIVLYNDVPGKIASGASVPREQYQVTKNRLSSDGTKRVLDLYYSTYFQTDEYGRPVLKNGKRVENITAMRKAIEEAVTAYRAKTGQKTGSIDPVAFREYVESNASQGEALKHMNKLRNLFNEILPVGDLASRRGLGLTPVEAAISRKVLVESLGVEGIEPEKLEAAILANPRRAAAARPTAAKAPVKPATTPAR
jgi:hypothetical protein